MILHILYTLKKVEDKLLDLFGREIREGDIVARAIHSSHTFHRVLRITPKGVKLSRGYKVKERTTYWYTNPDTGRFGRQIEPKAYIYRIYGGGETPEDVESHDGEIYIIKKYLSLVLAT